MGQNSEGEGELGMMNIRPYGQGEDRNRVKLVCVSDQADPWAGVHIGGELSSRGGLKPLEC